MSLLDRLAIVTGGGSGIGKAVCHALVREGAVVVVADLNFDAAKKTVAELNGKAHVALQVDVGDSTSVTTLIKNIGCQFQTPLSIVVNCAGVAKRSSVVGLTEETFDHLLRVNLKSQLFNSGSNKSMPDSADACQGTFLVNQAAVKAMLVSRVPEAAIVNIASILGKCGLANSAAYAASKGGVIAFTKSLAQELAGTNIRVNALLPGLTQTPMLDCMSEENVKALIGSVPMRRIARPEEVADAAAYLCSSRSSYITGTSMEVAASESPEINRKCLCWMIVTGRGSGIGKAVCHALVREGAVVVVADINLDAAKKTVAELNGKEHLALHVDVGDATSVASLINKVGCQFETPLSIVVNCAGVAKRSSVVDMPEEAYDHLLRVNLKGTFLVNQAAVKAMLMSKVPEAAIVDIASILGKCGLAKAAAYAASKGGVIAFTKSLAQELGGTNVRVNALLPGTTQTPMLNCMPEDNLKALVGSVPMKRLARPEEVADAAAYLCSPGSSYITGTSMEVAGGWFA